MEIIVGYTSRISSYIGDVIEKLRLTLSHLWPEGCFCRLAAWQVWLGLATCIAASEVGTE